jgi:hypothetical protein
MQQPCQAIKKNKKLLADYRREREKISRDSLDTASIRIRKSTIGEEILDLSIRARMIYIDIMYILHLRGILRQSTVGLPLHCRGLRDDVSFAKDLGVVDAALRENLHAREKPNTPKEKQNNVVTKEKE